MAAANAGATAVGLNFYSKSKRFVTAEQAADVVELLPSNVSPIGVFVDTNPSKITQACEIAALRGVQLHGQETPAQVAAINRKVGEQNLLLAKAIPVNEFTLDDVEKYLTDCLKLRSMPDVFLLDSAIGASAGRGEVANWQLAQQMAGLIRTHSTESHNRQSPQIVLAGGLSPANVESAIDAVKPDGVDVASGVESSPGVKDAKLMVDFVKATTNAFCQQ